MSVTTIAALIFLSFAQSDTPKTGAKATPPPAAGTPPPAAATNEPITIDPTVGPWLVDLARHQGHLIGRSNPRSAALQVLSLLRAATIVTPDCTDAYYWLFDIENRLGRTDAARRALAEYARLNPTDEAARLRLFELDIADRQTAEERVAFVRQQIELPGLSRIYESELHGWMARYYYERRENGTAAGEIEHALRLNPMNVGARQIAYELFSETEPSLQRVEMALQLIAANPSQTNLVWDLGEYLDRLAMHVQAQEWYNRAIQLHRQSNSGPIPADYWHKLAVSYLNCKDYAHCLESADAAIKSDPNSHITRLLRATAYTRMKKDAEAAAEIEFVANAYESEISKVTDAKDYPRAAEIAWFFAFHKPDPAKAMRLAEFAMKETEPSALARLAYGYALRKSGKTDQAIAALKPLAAIDQLAAYELAQIEIEQGKKGAAITTLHKAATLQYEGVAFDLIADLMRKSGETPPVTPKYARIEESLLKFNRDVFDYFKRPQDFVDVSMTFVDSPLPKVGPIRVTFRIDNAGPFPVTFGEGFMARPLIALSAKINGNRFPSFDNYLQVLLNSRPTLLPGDAIEKTVSINVGPVQQALLQYSGAPTQIRLTAMFDPVVIDGKLTAGPGSIELAEINGTRPAIDATKEGISRLVALAASSDTPDRIAASDEIGALLAAIEAAEGSDQFKGVQPNLLHAELAKLLNDEVWQVRACAVVAAGWSTLDPRVTSAASPRVRNENDVVRLLAVRLFAEQHGEKFRKVLDQMAANDPSEFVRMMAASYLPESNHAAAAETSEDLAPVPSR